MAVQKPYPSIHTNRLILSPMSVEDEGDIFLIRSEPEVMKWTSSFVETDISETRKWLSARLESPNCFNFSIRLQHDEFCKFQQQSVSDEGLISERRVIGVIGAHSIPEIGYLIHPTFQRRGYATEALQAFLPHFWRRVPPAKDLPGATDLITHNGEGLMERRKRLDGSIRGFDYVDGYTDPENVGSQKVMKRCGFILWQFMEKDIDVPMQGIRDSLWFRLARPGTVLPNPPQKERDPYLIQTSRLILRPMTMADAQDFFLIRSEPSVMKFTHARVNKNVSETEAIIRERLAQKNCKIFSIRLNSKGLEELPAHTRSAMGRPSRMIGVVGSRSIPQVAYLLHPTFHGLGYATEALQGFITWFWANNPSNADAPSGPDLPSSLKSGADARDGGDGDNTFGYDYLDGFTTADNVGSQKVLTKCGFTLWAKLENVETTLSWWFKMPRPGSQLPEKAEWSEKMKKLGVEFSIPPG